MLPFHDTAPACGRQAKAGQVVSREGCRRRQPKGAVISRAGSVNQRGPSAVM